MDLHFHCAIIEWITPPSRGAMRLYEDALLRTVSKRRRKKVKQYKEIEQKERRKQNFFKERNETNNSKETYRQGPLKLMEKVLNLKSHYFDSSSHQYATEDYLLSVLE
jgi:hypothetical protein